jgi:hypothetical protein
MKLESIPENYIKETINYDGGSIVIFDEDYIPFDGIKSPENGVAFFDENKTLKWIVNGVKSEGFWQESGDCFTGFYLHDEDPVLTTFSCHVYNIDMINGNLSYREMSK